MRDPYKFTTIGHADHVHCSPLSAGKAAWLVGLLGLGPQARILDIGCGKGALLLEAVQRYGCRGVGVDPNPHFMSEARRRADEDGVLAHLTLHQGPLAEAEATAAFQQPFDAVFCLGASQAVGRYRDLLAYAHSRLRPGGRLLVGDGYWKRAPSPDYLAILGAAPEELATHAENLAAGLASGYRVLATATASDDEWDVYEGLYCRARTRHALEHPDDPDATELLETSQRGHQAYLRWGRDTLGFGYYLLRRG